MQNKINPHMLEGIFQTEQEAYSWIKEQAIKQRKYAKTSPKKVYKNNCTALTKGKLTHPDIGWHNLHVDHIFPIYWGFKLNIPEYVICDKRNLQILTKEDNIVKGHKITNLAVEIIRLLLKEYGCDISVMPKIIKLNKKHY